MTTPVQRKQTQAPNSKFTSQAAALPAVALLGTQTQTLGVTPVTSGDVLAVGDQIIVNPSANLPAGLVLAWARVTAQNQITIAFSAVIALSAGASITWTATRVG